MPQPDNYTQSVSLIQKLIAAYHKAKNATIVKQLFDTYSLLLAYRAKISDQENQIMGQKINIEAIAAAAEAKIQDQANQLAKSAADLKTAQDAIVSQATSLNAKIFDLQSQITGLQSSPQLSAADQTELAKLAAQLNIDPATGLAAVTPPPAA